MKAETLTYFTSPPERCTAALLDGTRAVTLRHGVEPHAADAARAVGLAWPARPGALAGQGLCLTWRSPSEVIAVATSGHASALDALLAKLRPGAHPTAVAVDLSDAIRIFELTGPGIDGCLERLVDASAVPRHAGQATRCRLADAAVMLLRLEPGRLWLMSDAALAEYVGAWLDQARS